MEGKEGEPTCSLRAEKKKLSGKTSETAEPNLGACCDFPEDPKRTVKNTQGNCGSESRMLNPVTRHMRVRNWTKDIRTRP